MTIFIVSSTGQQINEELNSSVSREIADADRYSLTPYSWLVAYNGTLSDVANKLGIKKDGITGFVSTAELMGVGPADLANWIRAKSQTTGSAE